MEIAHFFALHGIVRSVFLLTSIDDVAVGLNELFALNYYDRDRQLRPHILAEGYVVISCQCNDWISLVFNNETEIMRNDSCTATNDASFVLHTDALAFGEYRCRHDQDLSKRRLLVRYKICKPTSMECRVKCDRKQPNFCLVTQKEIYQCAIALETEENWDIHWSGYGSRVPYYCPIGAMSFGEALAKGLDKVYALSLDECSPEDEMYYFYFNDKKLHYMEVVQVVDRQSTFKISCPKNGPKTLARVYYLVASGNRSLDVEDKRYLKDGCFGTFRLSKIDKFTEDHAPYRLQVFLMLGSDQREYQTRNYFVIFKDKLELSELNRDEAGYTVVRVKMPRYLDPEFTVKIEAILVDEQGKAQELHVNSVYEITVPRTGTLKVIMNQYYRSCAPYADFEAPTLAQELSFRDNTEPPEQTSTESLGRESLWFIPFIIGPVTVVLLIIGGLAFLLPEILRCCKDRKARRRNRDKPASNRTLTSRSSTDTGQNKWSSGGHHVGRSRKTKRKRTPRRKKKPEPVCDF